MSRIANSPVEIPKGVEVTISGQEVSAKGAKGSLTLTLHDDVAITQEESELKLSAVGSTKQAVAMSGTFRSLVKNLVTGVSEGFEKKLELQGVGYRAQAQGPVFELVTRIFPPSRLPSS